MMPQSAASLWLRVPAELRFPDLPPGLPADGLTSYREALGHCKRTLRTYYNAVTLYLQSPRSRVDTAALFEAERATHAAMRNAVRSFNAHASLADPVRKLAPTIREIDARLSARTANNDRQITTLDVVMTLREARSFYKLGNAVAPKERTGGPGNAAWVHTILAELRRELARRELGKRGQYLQDHGLNFGDSPEMALLTAHKAQNAARLGNKLQHLWVATARESAADCTALAHQFVLLSDQRGVSPHAMAWQRSPHLWVIDTWMNIACRATQYPGCLEQKLSTSNATCGGVPLDATKFVSWVCERPLTFESVPMNGVRQQGPDGRRRAARAPPARTSPLR
jgi:hypothetical protein